MNSTRSPGAPPRTSSFFHRTPWGGITLVAWTALLAAAGVASQAARVEPRIGGAAAALCVLAMVTVLVSGIIGAMVHDGKTRENGDPFRVTLRRGRNPFGVSYAVFLVGLFPVALGLNWLLGGHDVSLHFLASMSTMTLLCTLSAALVRPRQLGTEAGGLWFDAFTGRRTMAWSGLDALVCDPERHKLHLRARDGRLTTLRAGENVTLKSIAARLRAEAAAASVTLVDTLAPPDSGGADPRWSVLEQGRRGLKQWHVAMASLARADEGFRQIPVTREDLVGILLDDRVPAERRIGAALGLTGSGDPEAEMLITRAMRGRGPRAFRSALARVPKGELSQAAMDRVHQLDRRRS